jgi:hypothetical protein
MMEGVFGGREEQEIERSKDEEAKDESITTIPI